MWNIIKCPSLCHLETRHESTFENITYWQILVSKLAMTRDFEKKRLYMFLVQAMLYVPRRFITNSSWDTNQPIRLLHFPENMEVMRKQRNHLNEFIPRHKPAYQVTTFSGKHGGYAETKESFKQAFNENMTPISGKNRETVFRWQ